MARPGVTYLEVSNEAQRLVAAGKSPTIENIRIALGTGSNTTLGAHLRKWKELQDQDQKIATKEHIPTELIASLKGVWGLVMEQSEAVIQEIKDETNKDLEALKHEINQVKHDNTQLQQQIQQLKHEKDSLNNEKASLEQLVTKSNIEIAGLTEKISRFETSNSEKQAHINDLNKQNKQIQDNLEHYRAASLEQRLADQLRYEQQQAQLETALQQAMALQQRSHQVDFENQNLKSQLNKAISDIELTTVRLTETSNNLIIKHNEHQNLESLYSVLQAKFDAQNVEMLELKTKQAVLNEKFLGVEYILKNTNAENKSLKDDNWVLGQENAQLCGQIKQLEASLSKYMLVNN